MKQTKKDIKISLKENYDEIEDLFANSQGYLENDFLEDYVDSITTLVKRKNDLENELFELELELEMEEN